MADKSSAVTNDYDRFFAMSLDLLCIAGFDGYFKEVNPSWERILGWTSEELTGRPFIEFVHPDDQQATIAEAQRLGGGALTISFENRYRCRDGSYRWLVWTANGSTDDQQIFAVARDVTEHKDVAHRLERITAEYRALLDSAAEAMWGVDREGKTLFVNRATTELLGWETDELIGRVMHDVVHHTRPDGSPYPSAECPVAAVALNGESVHVDIEILWRKDGTSFPAEYRATPFVVDGEVVGAVVTSTDISDRMQAAEARRAIEAERRLALSYRRLELLRDIDKGILAAGSLEELAAKTLDRLRNLIAVEQCRLVIFDFERGESQVFAASSSTGGPDLGVIVPLRETPFEKFIGPLRRGERVVLDLDEHSDSPALAQRRATGIRTIAMVPLLVEGELVAMLTFSKSSLSSLEEEEFQIAEEVGNQVAIALRVWRLRGEEALRLELARANERLRAADEMKNLFLTAASHDVRGRIAAILGYAELVARADDRIDAERTSRFIGEILRSARALDGLLADLLNLDRLFRGALEPQRSVEDVAALIRRVVDEQGITSRRRVELNLDEITQQVDRVMVERSVDNLVKNAERYTPPDSKIWVHARKISGGTEIVVEDAGPGVAEHDRLRIFEPFRRGSDTSQRPGGSGVGLYLVSRFAELQGGRAWVQDREGGGASFHLTLPDSTTDKEMM
ncbi:MAG TPA: PAS domain S-box protein [Actinomycetota bacterium]